MLTSKQNYNNKIQKIKCKQENKNTTTDATKINVHNDVYIYRGLLIEKASLFAFKHIHETVYVAI